MGIDRSLELGWVVKEICMDHCTQFFLPDKRFQTPISQNLASNYTSTPDNIPSTPPLVKTNILQSLTCVHPWHAYIHDMCTSITCAHCGCVNTSITCDPIGLQKLFSKIHKVSQSDQNLFWVEYLQSEVIRNRIGIFYIYCNTQPYYI